MATNDFEITLELGCYKYPPHDHLRNYWEDNREALIAFIEHVHTGIKGFVLDQNTGEPLNNINATIEVDEIHHKIVSGPSGDYFRLLKPEGTYTVSAIAPGYDRSEPNSIYVPNALVDPQTEKLSAKTVNFTLSHDKSQEWSAEMDFQLSQNLEAKYLSNDEMRSAMGDLGRKSTNTFYVVEWHIPYLKLNFLAGNRKSNLLPAGRKNNFVNFGQLFANFDKTREVLRAIPIS